MKKPKWVIEKERTRRAAREETLWLFGLHAVRAALVNPAREKLRLVATRNALERLGHEALAAARLEPEIADARRFPVPLDPGSVHQGVALEVRPLEWGSLGDVCAPQRRREDADAPRVVLLDRVSDPHNAGAILRTAAVFGARAVIAPRRHAAPESGALAKAASGALELQPYLRVPNLARAMTELKNMGYTLIGLDGAADAELEAVLAPRRAGPIGLVLGAEGPGMRALTRESCDHLARIAATGAFASLNVSNAAAVALYAAVRAPG
ncbi:23S rRNA (guanosine2251-2'-O)-methyltransferase [Meinhardsimonia xiamenensis]|jgi:23S rRNA (guanosine2251-2'-O)-methyltransferase|uniref:23S rRNA (Guanosine2251-2'-O)-methyltransferase n=1 Tax=Meinhardsimonia xiamenensis TaxID=990712 RepID=A0A1G9FG47_9RHOB|nr:23S rRNA (guanosine(2251)-2'-O)-methyltransferase RlmB [Meinhardsimonia xiamenensis]PRX37859.1 23S rRNA (guanosine2251-2'-O)-methyltransferase [Meinhardsimonia xiamenensis]SDK87415.1 23S rRNA (guanosine2251-2'-O)-methyltransferase [Meinhardsimonia xiamenensis]